MPSAVVLLSGGLDSATVLALAKSEGFDVHTLCILYGQRHKIELESARRISAILGAVEHREVHVDLAGLGGSALTDDIDVPKDRASEEMEQGIPVTYVPARNTVFLSIALGYAEVIGARDIFVGVNAVDYSGYPDCRPEFVAAFEQLANLATKAGVEGDSFSIHAPLIDMGKPEIIRTGIELGVDFGMTHSCYDPDADGKACGRCDACLIRSAAFQTLGMEDPVLEHLRNG
ncbi:MAG: 7-cyano-7-deazaguanine synthase QueC [Fimbriimonadaceae bacterium]|nr:7-cyano-7-deazaguanine synthase QueC [Fimbriimonadaceae bacterium]